MSDDAKASRLIHADPKRVWTALTSREGMRTYMMGADVQTDWKVGSPITMRGEFNGRPFEDHGEVRSFEPGRRLAYTHRSGAAPGPERLVTFELAARDDGTEVTVVQSSADGRPSESDRANKARYEETWAKMLEGLERAAAAQ
jgi:uncharacterized protein YndB with AHSA1/START domain